MQTHRLLTLASLTAFSLAAIAAARAGTVVEAGDAGQTLITAQDASTVAATQINGSLANPSDADLYRIYISSPSTFSATTVNDVTNAGGFGVDTELSLFDAAGHGVATNDDASGITLDSTLPAGNALYSSLSSGYYFLGISSSGNEAINSNSQLIFSGYPGGDTTAVRGPASGLNPTVLSTFNSNEYDTTTFGPYEIDLTGTSAAPNASSAPEPSQTAALAFTALGLGGLLLRARKKKAQAS